MGYCNNCGSPCKTCAGKADEFNLMIFPAPARPAITRVLEKMGLNNDTHQSQLVKLLAPYRSKEKSICAASRVYLAMENPPKNLSFFAAMVKNKVISGEKRLSALPPRKSRYDDD